MWWQGLIRHSEKGLPPSNQKMEQRKERLLRLKNIQIYFITKQGTGQGPWQAKFLVLRRKGRKSPTAACHFLQNLISL